MSKNANKNWTPDEDEALAKAWIKISVDREVGDRQTKLGFWRRVTMHFQTLVPTTEGTHHQLNSKWTPMHQMIQAFNGYYIQAKVDATIFKFMSEPNSILKNNLRKLSRIPKHGTSSKIKKKWQEQPLVNQASESTGSSKKRNSSESSSAQTPTNETPINVEDFDFDLPNLNKNPTPSRQPRSKKKVDSGDTSRSSMRDTLASYAAEKKNLLLSQYELQKRKDEEYFNFIDGEVRNCDMKFVMDPHDNIPDPAFKQFIIEQKRKIYAKYEWPCSL
ncbi:hypothetical protein CTI12_AA351930 [Artemisia annua]|uniref:Myb-like domain, Myb/SANT-like DNA-binding domain protein n=1 Tax=Artemisia annua TaxID=35608 RepID=A0A2U1ML12_ARTAN|nr:hypothetical protein CTI12_AA351930 [Artemisia annua]